MNSQSLAGQRRNADSAKSVYSFSTSAHAGLGDQLPAGILRFYMRDKRGDPQFIGESRIDHTPMGSTLSLATGDAFDVKVHAIVDKRTRIATFDWQTDMRYELSNALPRAVVVKLIQDGLWGDSQHQARESKKCATQCRCGRVGGHGARQWQVHADGQLRNQVLAPTMHVRCARWLQTCAIWLVGSGVAAPAAADILAEQPSDLSVTVYRAPYRNSGSIDLNDLGGFALVSETRTVHLPAGLSRLKFEGVADGIEPASAIVTGLPQGVIEKNRDAKLLSPSALIESALGKPVELLRSNRKTGKTERLAGTLKSDSGRGVVPNRAGHRSPALLGAAGNLQLCAGRRFIGPRHLVSAGTQLPSSDPAGDAVLSCARLRLGGGL